MCHGQLLFSNTPVNPKHCAAVVSSRGRSRARRGGTSVVVARHEGVFFELRGGTVSPSLVPRSGRVTTLSKTTFLDFLFPVLVFSFFFRFSPCWPFSSNLAPVFSRLWHKTEYAREEGNTPTDRKATRLEGRGSTLTPAKREKTQRRNYDSKEQTKEKEKNGRLHGTWPVEPNKKST